MMRRSTPTPFVALALALLALVAGGTTVLGHAGAGTPQISNQEMGPYRVFVWSDPQPAQVGEYHVAVALTENIPGDTTGFAGDAVLDAEVLVTVTHAGDGTTLTAPATHENAVNKVFYEAEFDLPEVGQWQVEISVQSPDGPVSIAYAADVQPASLPWMTVAGGVLAVLLAVAALVLHWKMRPQPAQKLQEQEA